MDMESYFKGLVSAMDEKIAKEKTARRVFVREIGRIGLKLFDERYSAAWTGVFVPFEIFQAMDVGAVFIEFVGAMLGGSGQVAPFLQSAEEKGFSADACAYHRALIGAAETGMLGKPNLIIGATTPCDGGLKTITNLALMTGIKPFILDIPYPPVTREKVNYMVGQYKEMISYIEERTGKKADPERLRESARNSNEAVGVVRELYNLCKEVPAPVTSETLKNFQIVFSLLMGTREAVAAANVFLDEAKAHKADGCVSLPEEDFRLMWVQNRIQYKNSLLDYLQNNFKAKVVIDELNYIFWDDLDEDNPLEGLALRQMNHPLNGPADHRLDALKLLAKEYRIDGVINPNHWGCRQNCAMRELIKSAMTGMNIPTINLDIDCVDKKNYFEGQILTRLQSFMEILTMRKE